VIFEAESVCTPGCALLILTAVRRKSRRINVKIAPPLVFPIKDLIRDFPIFS